MVDPRGPIRKMIPNCWVLAQLLTHVKILGATSRPGLPAQSSPKLDIVRGLPVVTDFFVDLGCVGASLVDDEKSLVSWRPGQAVSSVIESHQLKSPGNAQMSRHPKFGFAVAAVEFVLALVGAEAAHHKCLAIPNVRGDLRQSDVDALGQFLSDSDPNTFPKL